MKKINKRLFWGGSMSIIMLTLSLTACSQLPYWWPMQQPVQQQQPVYQGSQTSTTVPYDNQLPPVAVGQPVIITQQPTPVVQTPVVQAPAPLPEGPFLRDQRVRNFIGEMGRNHNFNTGQLEQIFRTVQLNQEILAKVLTPAEAGNWRSYSSIFLTEARISGGVEFWKRHESLLRAAEQRYGVPAEYIVAIIGVETQYGQNTGKFKVIDSLTTLAFHYPKRASFYKDELKEYLLLTREEKVNPHYQTGSYAGAMGLSQFISSSYRAYAVDFNNDGKRNLWAADDAVGSVANYFAKHKWIAGEPIAIPARITGSSYSSLIESDPPKKPKRSLAQLANRGVVPQGNFRASKVGLVKMKGSRNNDEYWIISTNFYVITRYNHSINYAMAVHNLAQEIVNRKRGFRGRGDDRYTGSY